MMAINVTDSDGTSVSGCTIYATGAGGINLHGETAARPLDFE
jgi:hypothetical protein